MTSSPVLRIDGGAVKSRVKVDGVAAEGVGGRDRGTQGVRAGVGGTGHGDGGRFGLGAKAAGGGQEGEPANVLAELAGHLHRGGFHFVFLWFEVDAVQFST